MGQWLSTLDAAPDQPIRHVEPEYFVVANDPRRSKEASWHVFAPNTVRTTAHATAAAIPLALLTQLRSIVLLFHLLVALFTLVRPLNHPSPWFRFAPWLVVWAVSSGPRLLAHFQVRAHDSDMNAAVVTKVCPRNDNGPVNAADNNTPPPTERSQPTQRRDPVKLKDVRWDSVVPGDVVLLRRHDRAGADLALLSSSNSDGVTALIDAGSSTGETELRPIESVLPESMGRALKTPRAASDVRLAFKVPFPRSDVSVWNCGVFRSSDIPAHAKTAQEVTAAMKDRKPFATG